MELRRGTETEVVNLICVCNLLILELVIVSALMQMPHMDSTWELKEENTREQQD